MSGMAKILLVDDEVNILRACRRQLRHDNYEIFTADTPNEALELVRQHSCAVVVSDQRMPQMTGTQLLEQVRELSPDTVRIILTGHSDMEDAVDAINKGSVWRFLTKPWDDREYRAMVHQAVENYHLVRRNRLLQMQLAKQNAALRELTTTLESKVSERTRSVNGLRDELTESFWGCARALSSVAELHSWLIGRHGQRVAELVHAMSQHVEMDDSQRRNLELGALLHDIGKVGIARRVLRTRPQNRTRQQERFVARHPVEGEAIVRMIPNVGDAPLFVRHHHESWDGDGYPDRLKGDFIPFGARIIAVANDYDKLTTDCLVADDSTVSLTLRRLQQSGRHAPGMIDLLSTTLQANPRLRDRTEVEILPAQLRPGMLLTRPIRSARGATLLPEGARVQPAHIQSIEQYKATDPIVGGVWIRRETVAPVAG